MNALNRFWQDEYAVGWPLEADSRLQRFLNTYIVATFMNTFPRLATRIFSRSRGELAQLLFTQHEGGSFRTLRSMYRFDESHGGDLINRLLMQSPAVKAARNRRRIAQKMLQLSLEMMASDVPKLVLAVGGGDGSQEAEVLARLSVGPVYYCGVDKDERAIVENHEVLKRHGLADRGFTCVGTIADRSDVTRVLAEASERFAQQFDEISVTVCQGIIEYLDIDSETNQALGGMLSALHGGTRADGSLIISQTDFHDRVKYLERGLSWYMRLRSADELASEVEQAGWHISTCEHEPMELITMCLAAKSDIGIRRLDQVSPPNRPHGMERVPASRRQRLRRLQRRPSVERSRKN